MFKVPSIKYVTATLATFLILCLPLVYPSSKDVLMYIFGTFYVLISVSAILVEVLSFKLPRDKAETLIVKLLEKMDTSTDNRFYNLVVYLINVMLTFVAFGKELTLLYIVAAHLINTHSSIMMSRLSAAASK